MGPDNESSRLLRAPSDGLLVGLNQACAVQMAELTKITRRQNRQFGLALWHGRNSVRIGSCKGLSTELFRIGRCRNWLLRSPLACLK